MKSRFRIAVISDELTEDFGRACEIASRTFGMEWIELRGMWDKNLLNLDIPALKIHMSDGENERAMIKDMGESAGEMLESAGAKNIKTYAHPSAPRWALHEAGIARMESDPKKSVLNQFQQTHDVKNLFVMDAAGFTSNPCQNPTLTIMALSVRSCDYLMAEMKRNNI